MIGFLKYLWNRWEGSSLQTKGGILAVLCFAGVILSIRLSDIPTLCERYCKDFNASVAGVIMSKDYHKMPRLILRDSLNQRVKFILMYDDLYEAARIGDSVVKKSKSRQCELYTADGRTVVFDYIREIPPECDSSCQ